MINVLMVAFPDSFKIDQYFIALKRSLEKQEIKVFYISKFGLFFPLIKNIFLTKKSLP